MKSLAPHDRPREKLDRLGPAGLGDNELLAVILGHGFRAASAIDVANDVLDTVRGVQGLTRQSQADLRRLKGIGVAKASQILAAVELGRRTLVRAPERREQLRAPCDVASYLLPRYGARPVEQFGIVLLDTKHRVLKTAILSVGTLDASLVHPREVFREAAGGGAAAIVLFHNHPSGDPTPSAEDLTLTARLVEAGRVMGIDVVDHLVLADARYCSFKEMGRL
ncbi:MAG TPA: JAB domain-containing protein [Acidobacteria bacterium]|nr:JAB domain-containing protein [Acidobacteriota bacterium]